MTRTIQCSKLNIEGEGLERAPLPGELGEKIYNTISKQAWQMWLEHQTILINEYRLSLIDPETKTFLKTEMEKFLFGEGSKKTGQFTEKS